MPDKVFRVFFGNKTKQKKALLFSAFSMSFYIFFALYPVDQNHHSGGVYRQIFPDTRVAFISIRRWFLLPQ